MICKNPYFWMLICVCLFSQKTNASVEPIGEAVNSFLYNQTPISVQQENLNNLKGGAASESLGPFIPFMDAMLSIHQGRFDLAYPILSKGKNHYSLKQLVKLHLFTTAEITDSVKPLIENINSSDAIFPNGYITDFNHITILRALLFLKQEKDALAYLKSVKSQKWHSDQALIEFKLLEAQVHLQFDTLKQPATGESAFSKKLNSVQKARALGLQGLIHKSNAQYHEAREDWVNAIGLLEKPNYLYAKINAHVWNLEFRADSTMSFAQFPPGRPSIENFHTTKHGGWPDNFCLNQDSLGRMYIGNSHGVLVFDGCTWAMMPQTMSSATVRFHIDSTGNIWSLGIKGLKAELKKSSVVPFVSTSYTLDSQFSIDRNRLYNTPFSLSSYSKDVWIGLGPYLTSTSKKGKHNYHVTDVQIFKAGNRLLKVYKGGGIWEFVNGEWIHLKYSLGIAALDVMNILQGDDKGLIIVSKNGIFSLSNEGPKAIRTTADAYLYTHRIVSSILLKDGIICIGTHTGGVVLFSQAGKLVQIIDANLGLSENYVRYLYQDSDGNIWIAHKSGVDVIEYPTLHSTYTGNFGTDHPIANILEHNSTIYMKLHNGELLTAPLNFEDKQLPLNDWYSHLFNPIQHPLIEGLGTISQLGEQLVVGSKQSLFTVEHGKSIRVLDAPLVTLFRSIGGDTLFSAEEYLLAVYLEGTQWKADTLAKIGRATATYRVCQNKSGVWFATHSRGMGRYILGNKTHEIKYYGEKEGLPVKKYYAYKYKGRIIAYCKDDGTMKLYNSKKDYFEDPPFSQSFIVGLDNWADEMYFWIKKGNKITVQDKFGKLLNCNDTITNWPPIVTNGQTNCSYLTSECQWWQGVHTGKEWGLAITNKAVFNDASMKLPPILTSIKASKGAFSLAITDSNKMNISPDWNTINVQFSYPISAVNESMLYSVRLIGKDSTWSEWDKSNSRLYSLDPGVFRLQIRAKNQNGRSSPILTFRFRVQTPWHSTLLARILYSIIFIFLIGIGFKLNGLRLQRQKAILKKLVEQRTEYIEEQKSELIHKNQRIEALMQDTVHRAMGHMQLTKNLLEMQSRRIKDNAAKNALNETKSRVTTLEQLQRMLLELESGNKNLSTKKLLENISLGLKTAYRPNDSMFELQMDIQDLPILPEYASTLGLLVSEIQMNAYKYAFRNTIKGLLQIRLQESNGTWKLEISDNGPGIPTSQKPKKTFGQQLISVFVQQLQGTMTINTQQGTVFKMVFPSLT